MKPHAILSAVGEHGPVQAYIFDMDGVLIHSMPWHTRAWKHYLEALGITVDDLEQRMHGKRNTELVWDFLGKDVPEAVAIEHGAAKERLYRELLRDVDLNDCQIPGVMDFLERHRHVPKALGSNAERENIEFALNTLGLRPYFPIAIDGMQVDRPKPFPDIYLKAAEMLRVQPEHCIVFEDSPAGAQAGLDAGMRVVGVESTPTEFPAIHLKIKDFHDASLERWLLEQNAM